MKILSTLAALTTGSVLTVGAMLAGAQADPAPDPQSTTVVPWISKRVCTEEDSVNCAWDAKTQGNGAGHSFIVRRMPHTGQVCYIFAKRADRKFDFCTRGKR